MIASGLTSLYSASSNEPEASSPCSRTTSSRRASKTSRPTRTARATRPTARSPPSAAAAPTSAASPPARRARPPPSRETPPRSVRRARLRCGAVARLRVDPRGGAYSSAGRTSLQRTPVPRAAPRWQSKTNTKASSPSVSQRVNSRLTYQRFFPFHRHLSNKSKNQPFLIWGLEHTQLSCLERLKERFPPSPLVLILDYGYEDGWFYLSAQFVTIIFLQHFFF